jgi:excisionase family DNA binding protein
MDNNDLNTLPEAQRRCRQRSSNTMSPSPTPQPEPQSDILDVVAVAALLLVHPVTIQLKAAAGEIPGRQIGNRWRFSRTRIMEWLSKDNFRGVE